MATYLYRLYDHTDQLLYVGISKSAIHRLYDHLTEQPWGDCVAKQTVERYDTRQEALDAEKAAIEYESPLHNVVHNRPRAWKTQRNLRISQPADGLTRGDRMLLRIGRHEQAEVEPVRLISQRWAQALLNDALAVVNSMVLEIGSRDDLSEADAFDDLVRSLRYLPYGDCCTNCMDGGSVQATRWPVATLGDGRHAYECHVCQNLWVCWYAGKPISLDVPA
jgi:predicted GIY-YIG superfamily endonuclease